jgi:GGDEF domain-containing protein
MEERKDSLLAIIRRNPERADILLKLLVGGPVVLLAWDRLASYVLPWVAVTPITAVLLLGLLGLFGYLVGRTVREADKFAVESSFVAHRLLSGSANRAPGVSAATPVAGDDRRASRVNASAFDDYYFRMRLDDEVNASRIEGHQMSLVSLYVTAPGEASTPAVAERMGVEIARLVAGQAKVISRTVAVGDNEFVFSLPKTEHEEARKFVSKLINALGEYWCDYGIATFPTHATNAEDLYKRARELCQESRSQSPTPVPLSAFAPQAQHTA